MDNQETAVAFLRLVKIMDELRAQCPWDRKQDIHSLRILTIEELYELVDAIIEEDPEAIKEELGDLLLHIVFYSKIGQEKNWFDIKSVLDAISDKLIRRHPHVYSDLKFADEEEVKRNWEKIKQADRPKGLLSGVPNSLPAIVKAYRLQEKTKQVGFEWEHIDQVWEKVLEEMGELNQAVVENFPKTKVEEEFGDLLFSLVNYARFLNIDPEAALEKCNRKFKSRFEYIENNAPRPLTEMNLTELDALWNKAKEV
ncbi:MAG: nucleoside triphosphate pyrophosphohydrolase [Saprospiraceae bacterium]